MFGIVSWFLFFFKQKTAYGMRISDWSSDVCSSDLAQRLVRTIKRLGHAGLIHDIATRKPVEQYITRHMRKTLKQMVTQQCPRPLGQIDAAGCQTIARRQRRIANKLYTLCLHQAPVQSRTTLHRKAKRRMGEEGVRKCRSRRV